MKTLNWIRILVLVIAITLICAACAPAQPTAQAPQADAAKSEDKAAVPADEKITIAFIPMQVGIPYFDFANQGAQEAAKELGIEVLFIGPTSADAAAQTNVINDLVLRDVDGLVVQAIDSNSSAGVLRKAIEKGIKVVTWGTDVPEDARNVFVNSVDYEEFGRHIADVMAEAIGQKGQVAIITAALTAPDSNAWNHWIGEQIKEKYPDMELLVVEPCDDDQDKAYNIANNLITAYPDLAGIIGTTSPAPPAAAQACIDRGVSGKIKVLGAAEPSVMKEYLKSGAAYQTILWDIPKFGKLSVYACYELIQGRNPVESTNIQGFGDYKVIDGQIVIGPPLDVNADNVDDFAF